MAKTKTSAKRKGSSKSTRSKTSRHPESPYKLKPGAPFEEYDPGKSLIDKERIARAFFECLEAGDVAGSVEVIEIYLNAAHAYQCVEEKVASKVTLSRNPTLRTIAQHMHAAA